MKLKIGTHNLNNLFERTGGMQSPDFASEASQILKDVNRLNTLLESSSYAGAVGEEILTILNKYFLHHAHSNRNGWFIINEARKKLFIRKTDGTGLVLLPRGRGEWMGGEALSRKPVINGSADNSERVIQAIKAHVLYVAEVENLLALDRSNRLVLPEFNSTYAHKTVIGGNEERGIDIGILTHLDIQSIGSRINDTPGDNDGEKHIILSRDCAEYEIRLPNGRMLWLLCNHFKSQEPGNQAIAKRARELISRFDLTRDLVVVAGDFNDTPDNAPLPGLLTIPNLTDVLSSPLHTGSRTPAHQGNGQLDYLLVSQPLYDHLTSVGIERGGLFERGNPTFPEGAGNAAQTSGQAAVWAEFDLP